MVPLAVITGGVEEGLDDGEGVCRSVILIARSQMISDREEIFVTVRLFCRDCSE